MNTFSKMFIAAIMLCSIIPATNYYHAYAQSQSQLQQMHQSQQQQQQLAQQAQSSQQRQLDPTSSIGSTQLQSSSIGSTQPSRVGIHDNAQQTSGEGANAGGTVTDPTLVGNFPGGVVKANCFGKVIQDRAQEHKENPDEGTLGSHTSNPLPDPEGTLPQNIDHETPRQGIGNQDQGHPAAHGAFNSQFDADDLANAQENCIP